MRSLLGLLLVLWGCGALAAMQGVEKRFDFGPRGSATIDYARGFVEAVGSGSAPVATGTDRPLLEAAALARAERVARELLALAAGELQVDGRTRLTDALTAEAFRAEVDAAVRGAAAVASSVTWVEDPISGAAAPNASVTVRLPLAGPGGLAGVVERHLGSEGSRGAPARSGGAVAGSGPAAPAPPAPPAPPAVPAPPRVPVGSEGFDALIVDATGINPRYEASLRPRLRAESGAVLFGAAAGPSGPSVRYAPSLEVARAVLGPGARPLVVTARSSPARGELLVSDEDGRGILEADRQRRFLAEGRVVIVVPSREDG